MRKKIPLRWGNPLLFFKVLSLAVILVSSNVGFGAFVAGQPKPITISIKKASLVDALNQIKNLPGVKILYDLNSVRDLECGDVSFENATIEEVLEHILKGTNLRYEKVNEVLLIKKTSRQQQVKESITIIGRAVDNKNQPLVGVNIIVKGTRIGAFTDSDGKYSIKIPEIDNPILVFSYIGMRSREIKINEIMDDRILTGEKEYIITLEDMPMSLDDVVVTGYENIRKESYTGSATRVSGEQIKEVASRNVISILQVFDPSFRIMENNAMGSNPNVIPDFYIRGQSGIVDLDIEDISEVKMKSNPSLPIFILDGLTVSISKIYDMDPNRIHSITILKDAAATAVYGSRASNGVIVIETIAPKAGVFNIAYSLMGNLSVPDLNSYDYFDAREKLEAEILSGYYIPDPAGGQRGVRHLYKEIADKQNAIEKGVNTYWLSLPLRVGYNHKHSLAIDGGSNNIRYGINFLYDQQKGVMKKDYRNRLGAELRLDYRIEKLMIINRASFNKIDSKDSPYGTFADFVKQAPYNELYDSYGEYVYTFPRWYLTSTDYVNPMYEGSMTQNFSKGDSQEFSNNLVIDWRPNAYLNFKGQIGLVKEINTKEVFFDPLSGRYAIGYADKAKGELTKTDGNNFNWTTNLQLLYNRSIGLNHISTSLGFNSYETKVSSIIAKYQGFPSGNMSSIMFAQEISSKPLELDNNTRLFGSFFRINYSYDDIYLFDGSVRVDGSTEFGWEKKYAPFWSLGIGLNIHKYPFLQNHPYLTQLKITATTGETGKLNFPPYAAKDIYKIFSDTWYATGMGIVLNAMGNPQLNWEKKKSYDLKLEINIKNGLLYLKPAYYYAKTIDMVSQITVPSSYGFTTYYDNMGKVENTGFELDIRSDIIKKKNLFLAIFGNLAHNNNKILEIANSLKHYNSKVDEYYTKNYSISSNDEKYAKPFVKYEEGGSTTSIFGMKSLGIDPTSGKEVFVRRDGTITFNWEANEQQILGNKLPIIQGAFGFNFQWNSLSMFTSFLYEYGGQAYNTTIPMKIESVNLYNYNADRRVLTDRWRAIGDITPLKDIADRSAYTRPTSRFVQDNNTFRFNSLSLAWTKKDGFVKRMSMSQLKLQFNMNDVLYLSTIKRERGTTYPYARIFSFDLRLTF